MRSRLAGWSSALRVGVEPGRGAHQLVDDHQAIGLERLAGRHVVDDAVGVLGREHLGRAIGMDEGRAQPAALEPGPGQALVFRGDHERRPREAAVGELRRRGRDHGDRVEAGIEQLDQLGRQLGHPVGAGEAYVARAEVQHLDDVLGLQDLGLEAGERQARPIAPPAEGHPDAGIGEQREHALLHPPLGQGEMDQILATLGRGAHRGRGSLLQCTIARDPSGCARRFASPARPQARVSSVTERDAGLTGPGQPSAARLSCRLSPSQIACASWSSRGLPVSGWTSTVRPWRLSASQGIRLPNSAGRNATW